MGMRLHTRANKWGWTNWNLRLPHYWAAWICNSCQVWRISANSLHVVHIYLLPVSNSLSIFKIEYAFSDGGDRSNNIRAFARSARVTQIYFVVSTILIGKWASVSFYRVAGLDISHHVKTLANLCDVIVLATGFEMSIPHHQAKVIHTRLSEADIL
jgi:hypothetical protein